MSGADFTARALALRTQKTLGDTGGAAMVGLEDGRSVQAFATAINRLVPVRPEDIGDTTDPDTCHLTLQAAIDYATAQERPVLFSRIYETRRPVYGRSNMILETGPREAGIRNILTPAQVAAEGLNEVHGCTLNMGGYHPIYMPQVTGGGNGTVGGSGMQVLPWKGLAQARAGDQAVTCANPADAALYAKGASVWVRSKDYYSLDKGSFTVEHPVYYTCNIVLEDGDPATGLVRLLHPVLETFEQGLISVADSPINPNTGSIATDFFGHPLETVCNARVHGLSVYSDAYDPGGYQAGAGNEFVFATYMGRNAHINGISFSRMIFENIVTSRRFMEVAMGASGNVIRCSGSYVHAGSTGHPIKLGERCGHNRLEFDGASFQGQQAGPGNFSLIYLSECDRNDVIVRRGSVSGYWSSVVYAGANAVNADAHDPGQTQVATAGNCIEFTGDLSEATLQRSVWLKNPSGINLADGKSACRENTVRGRFAPTVAPSVNTVDWEGWKQRLEGYFHEGRIAFPSTPGILTDCEFDVTGGASLYNYAVYGAPHTLSGQLNGVSQPGKRAEVTASSNNHSPDLALPSQRITFTTSLFQLVSPTNSASCGRNVITLTNGGTATVTPSVNATFYLIGSGSLPALAPGQSITLVFERAAPNLAKWVLMNPIVQAA